MCNPNNIQTYIHKHNINTEKIFSCTVKYSSITFSHQTVHFPLFIFTRSTNSVPPLLTTSCQVRYFAQWHCWNKYVCTYGTATWAANILCKEVLYNVELGWVWSYTNSIFSLYSVWHEKWKKQFCVQN
jgi:hypothetical protein